MTKYKILISILLLALFIVGGCKKDDPTTVLDNLSGSLKLPIPAYLRPGDELKYNIDTLTTLKLKDGSSDKIGYYINNTITGKKDTLILYDGTVWHKEFSIIAPDSLDTFKPQLVAFSDGYYAYTVTTSFTVVKDGLNGEASLTEFDINSEDKSFTDPRDGKTYYYSTHGGVDWMRQNLAWEGAGKPHRGAEASTNVFGRFYTHTEALEACPQGWTLPSEQDWLDLAKLYGKEAQAGEIIPDFAGYLMEKVKFNGELMWEYWPAVKISNKARFSAIPTGYATVADQRYKFVNYGEYALFWSLDQNDGMAAARFIYVDQPSLYYGELPVDNAALNVRCVRK